MNMTTHVARQWTRDTIIAILILNTWHADRVTACTRVVVRQATLDFNAHSRSRRGKPAYKPRDFVFWENAVRFIAFYYRPLV